MDGIPEFSYGTVHGRFLSGIADTADEDAAPNALPMKGYVEFSATEKVLRVTGAGEPVTVFPSTIKVNLDAEGYLAHNGARDITLWATDDPDVDVTDWRRRAKLALSYQQAEADNVWIGVGAEAFEFLLPAGSTVDLANVERLPVAQIPGRS
ncbi:MAG: hypothetical protein BGN98_10475 [Microbacterium sp. 69-7]|uniref:hypothetical protein n=1 Tax=Microbacterium sp. 69-7 TaxID=1895784 RepID=UPI0009668457|nr:hypothetical protein [Microbacterium sp. 69-7]OJU43630.1 MAG: hypothetical protein BGN98_10475 [Microbacterium sp. 69-7]